MSQRVFMLSRGGHRHVATWRTDRLIAYGVVDPSASDRTGAIYLGRVRRVDASLGAAFVEFVPGEDGLLPLARGRKPTEGSKLLVQLRRDRRGKKSARLSNAVTLVGRDLHLQTGRPGVEIYPQMVRTSQVDKVCEAVAKILPPGHGALLRPSIGRAMSSQIESEARRLFEAWESLATIAMEAEPPQLVRAAEDALDRVLRDRPAEEEIEIMCPDRTTGQLVAARAAERGYETPRTVVLPESQWIPSGMELGEALEEALAERVELASGGSLLFEPGETLVAIDVDSGSASTRSGGALSSERTRRALNLTAAAEIALQIRLRNLSGPMVIDFVSMRHRSDRELVVDALRAACCADAEPCEILPMSRFGLVEMVRRSGGRTLAEQLCSRP